MNAKQLCKYIFILKIQCGCSLCKMFLHSTRSLTDQIEKYTHTYTKHRPDSLKPNFGRSKTNRRQNKSRRQIDRRGIKSVSTTDEERKSGSTTDQAIQSVHFADGDRVEQASSIVALSPSFRRLRTR